MPKRHGNNPKRRIAPQHSFGPKELESLASAARYRGSAHHKKRPADYGFHPPANPRPHKSLCDGRRMIKREEATALFLKGLRTGMISVHRVNGLPKYVWAVDHEGEPYEAKLGHDGRSYHGYRLGLDDRAMRDTVIRAWDERTKSR